jgi:hypothetical protein
MWLEILVTIFLVAIATFILYKNIKKKASGGCDCGSCASRCPKYNNDHTK